MQKVLKTASAGIRSMLTAGVALAGLVCANTVIAQTQETLKMGLMATMSGGGASYGIAACRGWKMAADDLNAKGGVTVTGKRYRFEALCEDDKVNTAEATAAANKLMSRDRISYLGVFSSVSTLAAVPLTTEKKMLTVGAAGIRQALGPDKPYNFRMYMTGNEVGATFWAWVKANRPAVKRVAILGRDDAVGQSIGKDMKDILQAQGFQVVSTEYTSLASSDFYPVLGRILAQKPDAIEVGTLNPAAVGLVAKQTAELGWKGTLFNTGEQPLADTLKIGGVDNVVGRYYGTSPDYDSPNAAAAERDLSARYKKEFNEPLSGLTTMAYNGLSLIAQALQGANSLDSAAMTQWLQTHEVQTVHGTSKFGGKPVYGVPNQLYTPVWISEATPSGWKAITKAAPVVP
jgi:branched-chain amino acid transport system substrate-binding protein